ncbi:MULTISPECIES: hypothetical protein [Sanguibacter]|uniref:hypothetical protein n=1 Tax=Sanguibacter TaxID=60919 RepID=UPI000AFA7ACC|nr:MULTISPECIES: hypothetical protein [Sanguibacter]
MRRAVVTTVSVLAVGALAVGGVVVLLDRTQPQVADRQGCVAVLDGSDWRMSVDQADNAALIASMSLRRQMPARAATIGLATALQESRLENIDYGDRDSVGLFQQRPSQGWGSVEQIMDPVYSATKFYDGLDTISGYLDLPVTEAAQAVQRSGFPDAYAQHEPRSRAWAAALRGQTPAGITCTLPDAPLVEAGNPTSVETALAAVEARATRDLGEGVSTRGDGLQIVLQAAPLTERDPLDVVTWALGSWSVATASATGIETVAVADQVWSRSTREWAPVDAAAAVPAGQVRLTLPAAG